MSSTLPTTAVPPAASPAEPPAGADPESGSSRRTRRGPGRLVPLIGLAPFALYLALFFGFPVVLIAFNAFRRKDPVTGATRFSFANVDDSLHGVYRTALANSIQLAAVTAVAATVLGLLLAYAIATSHRTFFKELVSSSAAVLANFGGLPLAFLFVAVVGGAGVLTKFLQSAFGISLSDDLHFNLFSLTGVEIVYLYFLIPLMVLVITPALEGLRPQWREAAENLGATGWQYWRLVAGPVLLPNLLGSALLLFCSSLSAFATASALTNGTLAITPLQIDTAVSGNVLTGQENLAAALALDMIVIVVPLTLAYQFLQARGARWLR